MVATLGRVLSLVAALALPIVDQHGAKDILDAVGRFNFGRVGKEAIHGPPLSDLILKSVDKFLGRTHAINIDDEGSSADIKLTAYVTTGTDGRGICIDGVGGNGFIASSNVEGRESGLMSLHILLAGNDVGRKLGRVLECLLDFPGRNMKKEITITIVVNTTRNDQLGTSNDGLGFGFVVGVGDGDSIITESRMVSSSVATVPISPISPSGMMQDRLRLQHSW